MSRQLKLRKLDSANSKVAQNPNKNPVLKDDCSIACLLSRFFVLRIRHANINKVTTDASISNRLINQKVTPAGPILVGLVVARVITNITVVVHNSTINRATQIVKRFFMLITGYSSWHNYLIGGFVRTEYNNFRQYMNNFYIKVNTFLAWSFIKTLLNTLFTLVLRTNYFDVHYF